MSALRWIVVLLAALLSACGGSDDDNVVPAKTNLVVGQANLNSGLANQDGSTNAEANTLDKPGDIAVQGTRLYIADTLNNRVLGFNPIPTTNNDNADFVIGQASSTDNAASIVPSASTMNNPVALATFESKVAVSDRLNNRVLIWDPLPSGNVSADVVVGQADFDSKDIVCDDATLREPQGLILVDTKLIVADTGNNRVLIWDPVPTTHGESANIVLGQVGCTAAGSPTAATLNAPSGVWSDGTRLVVNDTGNNRVLIWNNIPTPIGAKEADIVLGQGDFTQVTCNDDGQVNAKGAATARTLCGPGVGVDSDGTQLFISDAGNHRIMVWSTFPTLTSDSFKPANVAMGQTNFSNNAYNDSDQDGDTDTPDSPSGSTLRDPQGIRVNGKLFFITDTGNHRVRIIE